LLRTGSQAGNDDEKECWNLECNGGRFPVDGDDGTALETAAADGKSRACHCGNGCGGDRADSQGDGGELNEGQGGVLWRATRRSDGEKALTIFIGGQKADVQTVDITK